MAGSPLNPTEFASAVTAISSAFGDGTRRDIFLHVHGPSEGVTAAEVAERFGLHVNVARHHLDKLAAGGYVEVVVERLQGWRGRAALQALPGRRTPRSRPASPSATTWC